MKLYFVIFLTYVLTESPVISQAVDYEIKEEYYDTSAEEQPGEPIVDEPPPFFVQNSKNITVREGENLELSCETAKPTQRVLLFKKETHEGGEMKQLVLFAGNAIIFKSKFKVKDLQFSLSNVNRKDAASYLCVYQTSYGDIQMKYEVNVEYPATVIPMKFPRRDVMKGDNVQFDCKFDGNPKPKVKWSRKNAKLPSGAKEENGKSIILMEVDRHVEGTYLCIADNGIGKPAVVSRKLVVQYAPEIITEKEIIRTGKGDNVKLTCIVHSRPHAKVTWSRDGNAVSTENNNTKVGGHRHSLTISDVTEKDFGTYTCMATNDIGNTSADINLTDLPMKPHFTSDRTSSEDDKYTLTWDTESYYPITEYRIKYRPLKSNMSDESSWKEDSFDASEEDEKNLNLTHKMKHMLTGLTAATEYEAIVSVKNELKWGDVSIYQFSTKKESASHITGAGSLISTSICLLVISRVASMIS